MNFRPTFLAAVAALFAVAAPLGHAQNAPVQHSANPWWQHAVFYEIYPRSYKDTNGDGTGDINGITEKLAYMQEVGIDAIWIAPAYPSPQVDFGYDISDYENVDPQYGTVKDMENLITEAKKHNIRILLDMVANHTSDKHKWFMESASSRTNPKADWYVWNDGIPANSPNVSDFQKKYEQTGPKGKVVPPNNWTSGFGGSAWEWVPARQQYYYHKFYKEQPDLNWRNPVVEKAMFDEIRFWLDRGVAGFRLDAIDTLLEDPSNQDEEIAKDENGKPKYNKLGEPDLIHSRTNNLPEIHDIIRRMRQVVDSYPGDRVLIGETYLPNISELDKWYGGEKKDELQLPMDTQVGLNHTFSAAEWRRTLGEVETQVHGSTPLLVIDNHDNPRMDRYCRMQNVPVDDPACWQLQKMLTTVLFTARDAALFYYGDEIGMKTTDPTRVEDVKDPVGRRYWPEFKGRDGERTPMQWTPGKNAGFSTAATTWLPIPPDYVKVNVQTESGEKSSMLNWYKRIIELRHDPILRDGDFMMQDVGNDDVLAFSRTLDGKTIAVVANFTNKPQQLTKSKIVGKKIKILAATQHEGMTVTAPATSTLPPYGVAVIAVME